MSAGGLAHRFVTTPASGYNLLISTDKALFVGFQTIILDVHAPRLIPMNYHHRNADRDRPDSAESWQLSTLSVAGGGFGP